MWENENAVLKFHFYYGVSNLHLGYCKTSVMRKIYFLQFAKIVKFWKIKKIFRKKYEFGEM